METVKQIVEKSLVSSGQFTPEQQAVLSTAIAIGCRETFAIVLEAFQTPGQPELDKDSLIRFL
jgi:hypothetical protein